MPKGEARNSGKGTAVRKKIVPENIPHGSTAGCHATKKPSDIASEGFGIKCTAGSAPYTQTLVASGNPAAMEESLGRKLCVPAFQSGMPFKARILLFGRGELQPGKQNRSQKVGQ